MDDSNKIRKPRISEKVCVIGLTGYEPGNPDGNYCKIDGYFLDTVYLKCGGKVIETTIDKIEYLEEKKISKDDKAEIVKRLIKPEFLKKIPIKNVIIYLNLLLKKYKDIEFWLDGFNPGYQAKSLSWWIGGGKDELRKAYDMFTKDYTTPIVDLKANLEKEKIGSDTVLTKRPSSYIDLFRD